MKEYSLTTEIQGNKRVIIDGCESIIDFCDEEIIVKAGRLNIIVKGRDLKIKLLAEKSAVVEGRISSVNYVI